MRGAVVSRASTSNRDEVLLTHIQAAYQAGRGVYGSPRIHAALHQQGLHCSRKRVARLMQENGVAFPSPPETTRPYHRQSP